MLLGEPPPTQADLHFRVLGIPVRVHPYFWIGALLLGFAGTKGDPLKLLLWIGVVFVSIVVHELGHATMQRLYGGHPWITLYSFGGLASCNDCDRSPRSQLIILLAGPLAGFLLAAVVLIAGKVAGHDFGIVVSNQIVEFATTHRVYPIDIVGNLFVYFELYDSAELNRTVIYLLYVNIGWGLLNLLPVYPLDGGQISRELFTLGNPRSGVIQSLQLSIGVAILIALYALSQQSTYLCLMFGYLAYASFQTLQMYRQHWR